MQLDKVEWAEADVVTSDLISLFRNSDVVIHLAWLIQPSHDRTMTRRVNQDGSRRVFEATAKAGVPALVYASSIGAYSPGPKDHGVDEAWPTDGVSTSFYSVDKSAVEKMLDSFEGEHPEVRTVRLRPALIFKREAGAEVRRLFAGPLLPQRLLRPRFLKLVPDVPGLVFQCVHSHDVGEAYRLAAISDARGAFNIAADPVLDPTKLAELFNARLVKVPAKLIRAVARWTWRLHLQPTPEGWVDMGLKVPVMNTERAQRELGWKARHTSRDALTQILSGIADNVGLDTPPLEPSAGGPLRMKEFLSGIGSKG